MIHWELELPGASQPNEAYILDAPPMHLKPSSSMPGFLQPPSLSQKNLSDCLTQAAMAY